MKILIIGATGAVGLAYMDEAIRRDHQVSAVGSSLADDDKTDGSLRHYRLDVMVDTDRLTQLVADHDVTLSALRPIAGHEDQLIPLTSAVLTAARSTGKRIYITGGASPLYLADGSGHTILSAPGFLPAEVRPIAEACSRQDALLDDFDDVDWIGLRPAASLLHDQRTGRYALGRDTLIVQPDGISRISYADFAVAMLDLVELACRPRQRLTVGW